MFILSVFFFFFKFSNKVVSKLENGAKYEKYLMRQKSSSQNKYYFFLQKHSLNITTLIFFILCNLENLLLPLIPKHEGIFIYITNQSQLSIYSTTTQIITIYQNLPLTYVTNHTNLAYHKKLLWIGFGFLEVRSSLWSNTPLNLIMWVQAKFLILQSLLTWAPRWKYQLLDFLISYTWLALLLLFHKGVYNKKRSAIQVCEITRSSNWYLHQATQSRRVCKI